MQLKMQKQEKDLDESKDRVKELEELNVQMKKEIDTLTSEKQELEQKLQQSEKNSLSTSEILDLDLKSGFNMMMGTSKVGQDMRTRTQIMDSQRSEDNMSESGQSILSFPFDILHRFQSQEGSAGAKSLQEGRADRQAEAAVDQEAAREDPEGVRHLQRGVSEQNRKSEERDHDSAEELHEQRVGVGQKQN